MKKINFITTLLGFTLIAFLQSCAPQMSAVWEKDGYVATKPNKLAVVALSRNLEARMDLENNIMLELADYYPGLEMMSGLALIPPNATKEDLTDDNIRKLLKKNNVDAVLTVSMVNNYVTKETHVDPVMTPVHYGFGGYARGYYSTYYWSDYYTEENINYVLESSIFDLREGKGLGKTLVWKGQDKIINPASIESGSRTFAKDLTRYLSSKYFDK